MKKIATLIFVSVLGGAITLGAYKTFLEEEQTIEYTETVKQPAFQTVNYTAANTNSGNLKSIDFTTAAEKTLDAVVHVKSVTVSNQQLTMRDIFLGRAPQRSQEGVANHLPQKPAPARFSNSH